MLPRSMLSEPSVELHLGSSSASHASGSSNTLNLAEGSSGLMNKPLHGWLHPDQKITENGVCYGVRYIGCLEINTSMKSLDFDTRSLVAKECINRLCEAAGLKTADKKKKVDKRLSRMLAEKPNMDYAGSNVSLTITSSNLNIVVLDSGEVIASHEMPNISFACGGDADTLDFVSYVAKDTKYGRACFVLECGGGLAQDVIITIGQAFELRYKRFLKGSPSASNNANNTVQASSQNGNIHPAPDDPEYYNDLPGKVPPDITTDVKSEATTSVKSKSQPETTSAGATAAAKMDVNQNPEPAVSTASIKNDVGESLIDFAADISNVSPCRKPEPEYVNTTAAIFNERLTAAASNANKNANVDVFDMQPLSKALPLETSPLSPISQTMPSLFPILSSSSLSAAAAGSSSQAAAAAQTMPGMSSATNVSDSLSSTMKRVRASVVNEPWFHGIISRKDSELLVAKDGDFLVRESQGSPGQYVLTGMQSGQRKHLLLIDPEGVIRTKDQVFDSISHLIHHHMDNSLPIVSSESALLLKTPVCKIIPVGKSIQV